MSQKNQKNLDIVRNIYSFTARQDLPAMIEVLDPKVEWRLADNWIYADRNPLIGPQAAIVEGPLARIATEWEGFSIIPEIILDAGDHIVVLGVYTGTYKTTRKQVRAQFAHVWTLARGKVQKLQQYTDTKQFADAVKG
jgi:ketosteroid isomerase-like protein